MNKIKVRLVAKHANIAKPSYLIKSIEGALTVCDQSPGQYLNQTQARSLIDSPCYRVVVTDK